MPLCIFAAVLGLAMGICHNWLDWQEASIIGFWAAAGLFFIALGFRPTVILGLLVSGIIISAVTWQEFKSNAQREIAKNKMMRTAKTGDDIDTLKNNLHKGNAGYVEKVLETALNNKQFNAAAVILNEREDVWYTVFHRENISKDDIKTLISKVSKKSKTGALEWAVRHKDMDFVKFLVEDCGVNAKESSSVLLQVCANDYDTRASEQKK